MREAKREFKRLNGRVYCEASGPDFSKIYGERGRDFIEAHHKQPISGLGRSARVTIEDLEMVCANCHRMLHRQPGSQQGHFANYFERKGNESSASKIWTYRLRRHCHRN